MQRSYIPECTIQNRNMRMSVLKGAFCDMDWCNVGFVNLVYQRSLARSRPGQCINKVIKQHGVGKRKGKIMSVIPYCRAPHIRNIFTCVISQMLPFSDCIWFNRRNLAQIHLPNWQYYLPLAMRHVQPYISINIQLFTQYSAVPL